MAMTVKIWGCRGSLPAPPPPKILKDKIHTLLQRFEVESRSGVSADDFIKKLPFWTLGGYGGHTACIEVGTTAQNIIVDAGSGIRRVGQDLLKGPLGIGRGEAHILMTHFHWDHLIGLPFFVPIFIPGNRIHIYAPHPDLEECVRTMFKKPFFPVEFDDLGAEVIFHRLPKREAVQFADIKVTTYELDHPDPCWGYRFENNGRVFSYCVDTEATRMSREEMGPDLPLYQGVNLMIFDAQYTFKEVTERINWGHSTAPVGLDIALREGVERIYFVHHDPAASDEKITQAMEQTREYYHLILEQDKTVGKKVRDLTWGFAYEGMEFEV